MPVELPVCQIHILNNSGGEQLKRYTLIYRIYFNSRYIIYVNNSRAWPEFDL